METNLTPKVTKIAGTPKEGSWSQVFWQEPADEEKKSFRGSLAAVIEIESKKEEESATFGREVFGILEKEYLNSKEGDVLEALEKGTKAANDHLFEALAKFSEAELKEHPNYGILAASLWGKVLYLAGVGGANAFLVRDGKIQSILKIPKIENVEVFDKSEIQTASGFVQEGDVVVLASSGFEEVVPKEETLELISQSQAIDDVTDSLAPKIKSLPDSSKVAVLFLKVTLTKVPMPKEDELTLEKEEKEIESKNEEQEISKQQVLEEEPLIDQSPKEEDQWLDGQVAMPDQETKKEETQNPIFEKAKSFLSPFSAIFSKIFPSGKVYARDWIEVRQKRKRIILIFLAVLVVVLLVSIGLGLRQKKISQDKTNFETAITAASAKYDEAKSIETLNKEQARKLYTEAQDLISQAKKYNLEKDKVSKLEADIKAGYEGSLDLFGVKPQVFMDLSLAKEGFSGKNLAFYNSRVIIWDPTSKSLIKLEIPLKSAEVVAGGDELSGVKFISFWEDSAFLVNPDKGVWKVDLAKKDKTKIIDKDSDWQDIFSSGAFILGKVYLADKKTSKILRYTPVGNGYEKEQYLKVDTNFGNATSLTIDGSIWILSSDGSVLEFNEGNKVDFALSGLSENLSSKSIIFTEADAKNLYILDIDKSKLFVFDKTGKYQSQYKIDGVIGISDFIVSEKDKIVLLLSGKNLYSFDLK